MYIPLPAGHLLSTGEIAAMLGVTTHRVTYIVRSRDIAPAQYVGRAKAFDARAVAKIKAELDRNPRAL